MTLRSRLVIALALAALVPTAVVVTVPLLQARRRAASETEARVAQAARQAGVLLEEERAGLADAADRAAADLRANRDGIAAQLRGLAQDFGLDRIRLLGGSGTVLASWGAPPAEAATLSQTRTVDGGSESLSLVAERDLGERFLARVAAVAGGEARIGGDPEGACGTPRAETSVAPGTSLCIRVTAADPKEVRRELLGAFAGTAAAALAAALLLGMLLAARIAQPIRALTERAEAISERHRAPLILMPEKDETGRLTAAFDRMLEGLSASEEKRVAAERVAAWEEMARRLAHEVKNPLSPIRLAVENLRKTRERAPAEFDRAFDEETGTILEEVGSLAALVDEFSQFARLPSPQIQPCDPRAVLASAMALYQARMERSGVRVALDDRAAPASFRADPEQLGRALRNVIQNALDAMEGTAGPALEATLGADASGRAVFRIRDSGPGFPPDALKKAFEPYVTTRRDRGGTGLGLAIARRIVAEHGGSIDAANAAGGGAVITIVI
jgi:nitrogen fixation/metabolism regulation signal transduction histidine kinase